MMMMMMMIMSKRHTEQSLYEMLELQVYAAETRRCTSGWIGDHPCNFKIVFNLSDLSTLTSERLTYKSNR